jgi:hypothetical protein
MPKLSPEIPKKEMMSANRLWINKMMDEGRTIVDIGPDPTRETSNYPDIISPYYRMLRAEIAARGYKNVVFE